MNWTSNGRCQTKHNRDFSLWFFISILHTTDKYLFVDFTKKKKGFKRFLFTHFFARLHKGKAHNQRSIENVWKLIVYLSMTQSEIENCKQKMENWEKNIKVNVILQLPTMCSTFYEIHIHVFWSQMNAKVYSIIVSIKYASIMTLFAPVSLMVNDIKKKVSHFSWVIFLRIIWHHSLVQRRTTPFGIVFLCGFPSQASKKTSWFDCRWSFLLLRSKPAMTNFIFDAEICHAKREQRRETRVSVDPFVLFFALLQSRKISELLFEKSYHLQSKKKNNDDGNDSDEE